MQKTDNDPQQKVYLWDWPTRIFHWSLVVLLATAVLSVQIGGNAMLWHARAGFAILGLLAFRLVWGLYGGLYARFRYFIQGPSAILAYLQGRWQGLGHNPLGALSVLAMLTILLAQGITGLFANDDISFQGPYARLLSEDMSAWLTGLHKLNALCLAALVLTHWAAIIFYFWIKKDNLVRPMLSGYKQIDASLALSLQNKQAPKTQDGKIGALLMGCLLAILVSWLAQGGLLEYIEPSAPPPSTTQNW